MRDLPREWLAALSRFGGLLKQGSLRTASCFLLSATLAACGKSGGERATMTAPVIYQGTCSASAAVPLGAGRFIVADDESNRLRVYSRHQGGPPVQVFDLSPELDLKRQGGETDIEGAACLGDRVYWITSHGRDKEGRERPNRYRFFATTFREEAGRARMSFVGSSYQSLIRDFTNSTPLRRLNLSAASQLPPKARGGLNIEGLCAGRGEELWIAFRNPLIDRHALLIPLLNPPELCQGGPARFGEPIFLDLDGLGIRDLACSGGKYLIVAGASSGGGKSKLFIWDGPGSKPNQVNGIDLQDLNLEALVIYPDTGFNSVQLLSDDSSQSCADLKEQRRSFRSIWVNPGTTNL